MIKIDFFNSDSRELLSCFCEYFHLNECEIDSYFMQENSDNITPNKFAFDFNLDLAKYYSDDIEIKCQHMTTTSEKNINKFYTMGLLDLKNALQSKTPLSLFLSKYGIDVNVDKKLLTFNNVIYHITSYGEPCIKCIKNKVEKCTGYSKCEFREKMDHLGLKLYKYGATAEFFIHSSFERMARYSSINRHPEILITIKNIISEIDNEHFSVNLGYEWTKNNNKCYVLEFGVKLSNMETFAPIDWRAGYDEYDDCIELSGYTYDDYMAKAVPQRVFDNIIFLKWFFSVYFYDSEILGSLLPDHTIPSEKVKYIEIKNDNNL